VHVYGTGVSRMFTGGCEVCEVCVYGRGVSRVFTGGCVKCVSTGEVCLGCSRMGVLSVCLRERCV